MSENFDISSELYDSSNNLNLKYERFTRSGCQVTGNRKLVAKTQFL